MDTSQDCEPQKRKRCDSGDGDSVANKKRASLLPVDDESTDSPASPPVPVPVPVIADDESPASPDLESPESPAAESASASANVTCLTPADMDCADTSTEDGELLDESVAESEPTVVRPRCGLNDDRIVVAPVVLAVDGDADRVVSQQAAAAVAATADSVAKTDASVASVSADADDEHDECAAEMDEAVPLMRIQFRDAETSARIWPAVQQAIRNALFRQQIAVDIEHTADGGEVIVTERAQQRRGGQRRLSTTMFMIDADAGGGAGSNGGSRDTDDVPQYSVNVATAYDPRTLEGAADEEEGAADKAAARPRNVCFNCDGDHNMRDCTQPRNAQRIRENRAQHGGGTGGRQERYHVDANQKYGHFEAGRLSKELRAALGLHDRDLPMHVYRMRVLGYPPGWLEAAKVSQSGLTLFADQEKQNEEGAEAGGETKEAEAVPIVGAKAEGDGSEFDLKQILSYPGYNVQPDQGTYDISYNLRLPPMQGHQSRAIMLHNLRSKSTTSYKRKKHIKNLPSAADSQATTDAHIDLSNPTMDIDDDDEDDDNDNPPVPGCEPPAMAPPPPPPPPAEASSDSPASPPPPPPPSDRSGSPSIDDLRQQQEKLLAALEAGSPASTSFASTAASPALTAAPAPTNGDAEPAADDSLIDDIMALDSSSQSMGDCTTTANETSATTTSQLDTTADGEAGEDDAVEAAAATPPATPLNSSIQSMSGTPLLESASQYTTLPSGENWSVGVSEIIDFENLADATGKFERMKGLIKKVRVAVKQLSDEYDG